jgi:hypothetical protein
MKQHIKAYLNFWDLPISCYADKIYMNRRIGTFEALPHKGSRQTAGQTFQEMQTEACRS